MSLDSFKTRTPLTVGSDTVSIYSLPALERAGFPRVATLPFSLKILLENLLRREDGGFVKADDIRALASWDPAKPIQKEISFMPARVLLQDFTGVPCVVDLAAMRDAIVSLGGNPEQVNPLQPVELVIDHSVQVDYFGTPQALQLNAELEYQRNRERYVFLRWGQTAVRNFRVVPPETGIVHQVNIEYLARVVSRESASDGCSRLSRYLFGTDSHTTMVNGLGVVGWGVGGIEAEAAMLGQPSSMLIPSVLGCRLTGRLPTGSTATDLVLTITEALRKHGVVGKFVEFYGPGLRHLTVADRVTLGNMCPEYGATVAIFPIDNMTLDYLRLTGREAPQIALVEAYARAQGLFRTDDAVDAAYSETMELDLGTVQPSLAGPRRPQDRVALGAAKRSFAAALPELKKGVKVAASRRRNRRRDRDHARSRLGRDRRDHELHQHLESERDDWRRPSGPKRRGQRTAAKAVGQDQPRARVEGGDRLLDQGRADARTRTAWFQPGGLWLHDLHRQQRSVARRDCSGGSRTRPGGLLGAQRQSELRRADSTGCARQLSGVTSVGRGIRARRHDESST